MEDAHRPPSDDPTAIVVEQTIAVTAIVMPVEQPAVTHAGLRDLVERTLDAVDELADDVAVRLGLR